MNDYIINPNIFYWISVINAFHCIFWAFGVVSLTIGMFMLSDDGIVNKTAIVWGIFGIIFILFGIFLPSKEVMYQMLASKYVTKDVAMKGLDYINNIVFQLINH